MKRIGHAAAVIWKYLKDLLVLTVNTTAERLWELMHLISISDCCWAVSCWWSGSLSLLWLRSDWTSAFRSAMIFFACRSLLSMFLIASSFLLTRLASSSKSASPSAKSRTCSSFCSFRFWNAVPRYSLRRSLTLCWSPEDCFCFPGFFLGSYALHRDP